MNAALSRRAFLQTSGGMAAGIALAGLGGQGVFAGTLTNSAPAAAKLDWHIGCQLYTYRRYCLYEALEHIAKLGIGHIEPCFFLPLDKTRPELKVNQDLSADVRKELKGRLADLGIAMSAFYSEVGVDADKAKKIFEFAKEMGASKIIMEPPAEAFDLIEKLCNEYQINAAVHNHPKGPNTQYWSPESVLDVIKGHGKRVGACCDTGHWVRSGLDAVECLKKMEGHILGFHLKDVIEKGKPECRDVPLGEGKANYTAVLTELKRQGFRGVMTIEYEHDSPELDADVAKCVAFVEKFAQGTTVKP